LLLSINNVESKDKCRRKAAFFYFTLKGGFKMALCVKGRNAFQLRGRSLEFQSNTISTTTPHIPSMHRSMPSINEFSKQMNFPQDYSKVIHDFHLQHLLYKMESPLKLFFSYAMLEQIETDNFLIDIQSFRQKVANIKNYFSPIRNQICCSKKTHRKDLDILTSKTFEALLHQYGNIGGYNSDLSYFIWDEEQILFEDKLYPVFNKYGFSQLKQELEDKIKLLSMRFKDIENWRFCPTEKKLKYIQEVRSCTDNLWFNDDIHLREQAKEVRLDQILYELQQGKCFLCGQTISIEKHFLSEKDHMVEPFLYNGKEKTGIWNYFLCHKKCSKERNGKLLPLNRFLEPWVKLNIYLASYLKAVYFKIADMDIEKMPYRSKEDLVRCILMDHLIDFNLEKAATNVNGY
jgi:hypothetical protein